MMTSNHFSGPSRANSDYLNGALAAYQRENFANALLVAEKGLTQHPGDLGLLTVAGNAAAQLGQVDIAERRWRSALAEGLSDAGIYSNLGKMMASQRRWSEAETAYIQSLAIRPDDPETLHQLGGVLTRLGRPLEAESAIRAAITIRPDSWEAHCDLGTVLAILKRFDEAEVIFRTALALKPDNAQIWHNLGSLSRTQKRYLESLAFYRRALELDPENLQTRNALGNTLKQLNCFEEAEKAYRAVLAAAPKDSHVHTNLGNVLSTMRHWTEAEQSLRTALALNPTLADAQLDLGLLLLTLGRYAEGWPFFEARLDSSLGARQCKFPELPMPCWDGSLLADKSILVWGEQGFGDQIQFIRFLPLLRSLGAGHITLRCNSGLRRLFERSELADHMIADVTELPSVRADFWIPSMSIPGRIGTTLDSIPNHVPYLRRQDASTLFDLPKDGLRIGLAWRGDSRFGRGAYRSLAGIHVLAPLWTVPGITFVSLQIGAGEDEATSPPPDQPLINITDKINDFDDTAAVVSKLDLVISIDTAVAHLAGALGTPCWVLVPYINSDWRWLQDRSDSPWYPKAFRIFRQQNPENWDTVISDVRCSLRGFAG